jgi:hypothetical protein
MRRTERVDRRSLVERGGDSAGAGKEPWEITMLCGVAVRTAATTVR